MPGLFTYQFDTDSFQGSSTIRTGLFINGQFVDPVEEATIDVINPATGNTIVAVSAGSKRDVDIAVEAARTAYKTSWGLKVPGAQRGKLLLKLADLMEHHADEIAALESLNVGKTFTWSRFSDLDGCLECLRYYAGWADKITGKTLESNDMKMCYTRHEPFGVVGQIIPWNYPLLMFIWKIAPALATGNTIVIKPSEVTPLSALRLAAMFNDAGFPPGVINVVNGYGHTVGRAISEHPLIEKIAFTGSISVGRKIMAAAAASNLKNVTLELGGKSPNIIFDDADLDQAVKWTANGIYLNMGQDCCAGSRIYVQEGIYPEFMKKFTESAQDLASATGDPFALTTMHGPQVSKVQFDRVMSYIESGKQEGATLHAGGMRHGTEGYFIQPTIFTDCQPHMKIVKEEIFGPVAAVIKFKDESDVIEQANDTTYGLASAVFSQNINRAIRVAQALEAGTAWINCINASDIGLPFGGYKQSGIGRECGEYALANYTQVKSVLINLGMTL